MLLIERINGLLWERYGGAAKERGIWYHGTHPKHYASIKSQGLIPNPEQRAWADDPEAGIGQPSRASYGGVYVTRRLATAASAATNHKSGGSHRIGALIVCMSLQPRALIADEDDFTFGTRDIQPAGLIPNPVHQLRDAWLRKEYGESAWYEDVRKDYIKANAARLMRTIAAAVDLKPQAEAALRKRIDELLPTVYDAAYMRLMGHLKYDTDWRSAAESAARDKAYRDGLRGDELHKYASIAYNDGPRPPTPAEGERAFREAVDQLTRTLKHAARKVTEGGWTTARSLEPIKFSGSNKIVAMALIRIPTAEEQQLAPEEQFIQTVEVLHGKLPDDFWKQYHEYASSRAIVVDGGPPVLRTR